MTVMIGVALHQPGSKLSEQSEDRDAARLLHCTGWQEEGGHRCLGTGDGVDEGIIRAGPALRDLLAITLAQMGYAVDPPFDPRAVAALQAGAGLLPREERLYGAGDLEAWQPCLVTARLVTKGAAIDG